MTQRKDHTDSVDRLTYETSFDSGLGYDNLWIKLLFNIPAT